MTTTKPPAKRQYQRIWETIRDKEPGQVTDVRVSMSSARTLIQAVKKEKTKQVAVRKKLGIMVPGKMEIKTMPYWKNENEVIISFKLLWDASKL